MTSARIDLFIGAVAGTLVSAGSAQAAVVYRANLNLTIPATAAGVFIDLNGNFATGTTAITGWDINIFGTGTTLAFAAPAGASNFLRLPGVTTGSAGSLPIVTTVDGSGSFGAGPVVFGSAPGEWALNASNYFGFRFNIGSATHYGWGRMEIGANGGVRTLQELAYDDVADKSICAGAVPGPGALALFGLAGAMARRRR